MDDDTDAKTVIEINEARRFTLKPEDGGTRFGLEWANEDSDGNLDWSDPDGSWTLLTPAVARRLRDALGPDSAGPLLADLIDRAFGFVGEHDGLAADLVNDLAWEARRLERELAEARDLLRLTYDEDSGLSVWLDTPLGQKVRAEQEAEFGEVSDGSA